MSNPSRIPARQHQGRTCLLPIPTPERPSWRWTRLAQTKHPSDSNPMAAHSDVHPRAVWGGTGLAIVGLPVVSVGLMAQSLTVSAVGLLAMAVGALVAWRG